MNTIHCWQRAVVFESQSVASFNEKPFIEIPHIYPYWTLTSFFCHSYINMQSSPPFASAEMTLRLYIYSYKLIVAKSIKLLIEFHSTASIRADNFIHFHPPPHKKCKLSYSFSHYYNYYWWPFHSFYVYFFVNILCCVLSWELWYRTYVTNYSFLNFSQKKTHKYR